MLKQHATLYRRMLIALDAMVVGVCFFLAYRFCHSFDKINPIDTYLWIPPLTMGIWGVLLYSYGMYESFRLKKLREVILIIILCGLTGCLCFTSIGFLFKVYTSRALIILVFLCSGLALIIEKMLLIGMFREIRKKGFNYRSILVVGTGKRAKRFIEEVDASPEFGLKIIGLIDVDPILHAQSIHGHRVIGTLEDIPHLIEAHSADMVVFIVPRSWLNHIEQAIHYCETVGIPASVAMDFYDLDFAKATESRLFGFPLMTFNRTNHQVGLLLIKLIMDTVLSFMALIILAPVFAVIAIVVKATSPGPVFFKQKRCGLNGRPFTLYKFRTMISDAEAQLETLRRHNLMMGPAFKMDNDPRITKVGQLLRKFSLDELPQLWNVLKGDMSLVGARPPLPQEVKQYDQWQRRRLSMRPGITCLWQINGRNKITNFDQWAKLDLQYIDNWSLWLDIVILFKTIPVVLFARGAK